MLSHYYDLRVLHAQHQSSTTHLLFDVKIEFVDVVQF